MTDHQEPDPLERLAAADPARTLPGRHDADRIREEIIMNTDNRTSGPDTSGPDVRTERRPRRRLLAGALAAAAVTVIAVSGGTDPDVLPRIDANPAGQGAANAAPTAGVAESAGADAKMIAPWAGGIEFVAAADFDTLDGKATAWVFRSGATPDDGDLARLNRALGIDGDYIAHVEGEGEPWEWGYWSAGVSDGSGPGVTVNRDPMLSWWYTAGWATSAPVVGCAVPEPAVTEPAVTEPAVTGETGSSGAGSGANAGSEEDSAPGRGTDADAETRVDTMPIPCGGNIELPENLPDETRTRELFNELLTGLGIDTDDVAVETYLSEWSSSITGWLLLDGMRTPLAVNATYGANGKLESASGNLARAERLGDYPRIGTDAGFAALTESYGWYGPMTGGPMVRADAAAASDATTGETADSQEGAEPDIAISEPLPPIEEGGDYPVTAPVTVIEIVGVEEDLYMLWGNNNDVYLLPGYSFLGKADDYGYTPRYSVIAISDEYFTTTTVTAANDGDGADGEPAPVVSEEDAAALVGLPEKEAVVAGEERGWNVRITSRDGEEYAVTMDYRTDRVNLTVEDGTVTKATVG